MDRAWNLLGWFCVFLSTTLFLLLKHRRSRLGRKQLPPGPPAWPIIGNIFDLGSIPHQNLFKLKAKYGPVLWLKLGSRDTLVIQSAEAAAELFKKHDLSFSDRKVPISLTAHNYHQGSLAIGRYGPNWRMLRRICSMELTVNKRMNETSHLRQKCIDNMLNYIEEDVAEAQARGESGEVKVAHYLFLMTFNLFGNLILSRDLVNHRSKDGHDFFDAMNNFMKWAGAPNVADFLPFLKWLDPQAILRNMVRDLGQVMRIVEKYVKERIEEQKSGRTEKTKDFLDVLLEYDGDGEDGPDKISERNRLVIILEMFFGGSETTSTTMEWAMTELFRHPNVMRKVKEELHQVVGPKIKVEESDIDQLPYLQAVVKETLRLHPVLPLLPRNALEDTKFMGYLIPKDTQVLVNAWAIGRDSDSWGDPMTFKPERFIGSNIEYKGQNYEFIPFGSGRRMCIGVVLAHRVLHLGLASLLHCFDWELGSNYTPETIDVDERMGLAVRKLKALKAIPKKKILGSA